mmetsp:Transcript_47682/g.149889  ORF Transcript_47682/g.149889 Transcript_47682/m.149889 type:complete len:202 (+) Transcript_47682:112-717(+)
MHQPGARRQTPRLRCSSLLAACAILRWQGQPGWAVRQPLFPHLPARPALASLHAPGRKWPCVVSHAGGGGDAASMFDKAKELSADIFDFEAPTFESGEQWRALTRIKVREEPSVKAPQLRNKAVEKGEVFTVAEERRAKIPTEGKHRRYLRIAGTKGWVFDLGVAGDWYGKPVAEPVYEDEEDSGNDPLSGIGDAVGSMFR